MTGIKCLLKKKRTLGKYTVTLNYTLADTSVTEAFQISQTV